MSFFSELMHRRKLPNFSSSLCIAFLDIQSIQENDLFCMGGWAFIAASYIFNLAF
jgi:hypothetical protein